MGRLIAAQLSGVTAGLISLCCGLGLWPAVAVSVGVGALLLIRVQRLSLFGWVRAAWNYRYRAAPGTGEIVDFQTPEEASYGLHWQASRVSAVVEVLAPQGGLTWISRDAFETTHQLPLRALAGCLTQHDITLSGVDIISHGFRSRTATAAGQVYQQLIGPLPAAAVRTVWIVVTLDALTCADAVARRGGGAEGASRAVTIAAQRIMRALDNAGCRSRALTAPEVREAALLVTAGVDPVAAEERWTYLDLGNGLVNGGGAVEPGRVGTDTAAGSELLAKLWVPESDATTVEVRLRPGATADRVRIGAAWRLTAALDAAGKPPQPQLKGTHPMHARHRTALLAHIPGGTGDDTAAIPLGEFPAAVLDGINLPQSGCGQLIGSDPRSRGVAARIVGQGISTVYVASELYVAQQLIFRALAVGARIMVRTDRAHAWEAMALSIGDADQLRVVSTPGHSDAGFTALLIDCGPALLPPGAAAGRAGITTIWLTDSPSDWPHPAPDVSLHQPRSSGNQVILRTGEAEVILSLVAIPDEAPFTGTPLALQHS